MSPNQNSATSNKREIDLKSNNPTMPIETLVGDNAPAFLQGVASSPGGSSSLEQPPVVWKFSLHYLPRANVIVYEEETESFLHLSVVNPPPKASSAIADDWELDLLPLEDPEVCHA